MALFEVKRYTTFDDAVHSESKTSVLEKLVKEAKKRKKELQATQEESQPCDATERRKRKREDDYESDNVSKKKKKKKKKTKSEASDAEKVSANEEVIAKAEMAESEGHVKSEGEKTEEVRQKKSKEMIKQEEVEEEEEEIVVQMPDIEGPHEFAGFTVLGDYKEKALDKVNRVLPNWLAHPSEIKGDVTSDHVLVSELPDLDADLKQKLLDNGITHFFPVQYQVIPSLLNDIKFGTGIGCGGFRARDICCSSPTGSGKTLAFVLPIIQALKNRVVRRIRALVILPVRLLALQVYNVFKTYAEDFELKVGIIMGEKGFQKEQMALVRKRGGGYESLVDIIVATPGKLVDHITLTEGFDLKHLRFLVIDEADRVIDDIKHDWLTLVEKAVYKTSVNENISDSEFFRPKPGPLTVANCLKINIPFQKLLFSATLSDNSQKIKQLNLFQPQLFSAIKNSTQKLATKTQLPQKPKDKNTSKNVKESKTPVLKAAEDVVQEFVIPKCLTEKYVLCTPSYKPLILFHLISEMKYRNVLCFTKSRECTHRLFLLAKFNEFRVAKITSDVKRDQKKKILSWFEAKKIDLLVCTDSMARGMDLSNVQLVVSYDCPNHVETYVHRVGRTARAGKEGTAISLLQHKEVNHFKTFRKKCGSTENLSKLRIKNTDLEHLIPRFKEALESLPQTLKNEKKRTNTRAVDRGI